MGTLKEPRLKISYWVFVRKKSTVFALQIANSETSMQRKADTHEIAGAAQRPFLKNNAHTAAETNGQSSINAKLY